MARAKSSSSFTDRGATPFSPGPPLIGALLRVPLETVRRRMLERLHDRGYGDLEAAHLVVLQYPGPQGRRPSDLAAQLRVSKQALNYLLGQLERLGYLERRPDPDDLRSKRIALTPRGLAIIPVVRAAVAEVEAEWARRLGKKRFDQLRTLLQDLNELDQVGAPAP
jgi:DNA-binding MarR family transcriptional regulator